MPSLQFLTKRVVRHISNLSYFCGVVQLITFQKMHTVIVSGLLYAVLLLLPVGIC